MNAVSFGLHQGAIGCLLGASGCGKTTLLRAVAGFEPLTGGEISLRGAVVSDPRGMLAIEKRRVGMVFQDHSLFPHLTVSQNIGFGLEGWAKSASVRRIEEIASLLEIDDYLFEYPHRMSGGQQQRVAIARAMAPRPDVLLLDEPFSSLDVELREQLAREIRSVLKTEGINRCIS